MKLGVLTLTLSLAVVDTVTASCVLKSVNFNNNNNANGYFNPTEAFGGATDFLQAPEYETTSSLVAVTGRGKVWQTEFPKGCFLQTCGVQYRTSYEALWTPLPRELWFTMKIRLASNFKYVLGGILPGICGGGCETICGNPANDEGGWSSRYNWNADGDLHAYVFDMDRAAGSCGVSYKMQTSAGSPMRLTPGTWHTLEMRVKINTANQNNGELDVYLDGELGYTTSALKWSNNGQVLIDRYYASMFYGGSTPEYGAITDTWIQYDDIVMATCRTNTAAPTASPIPAATPPPPTPTATAPPPTPENVGSQPTQSPTVSTDTVPGGGDPDLTKPPSASSAANNEEFISSMPGALTIAGSVLLLGGIAVVGFRRRKNNNVYREADLGNFLPGGMVAVKTTPGLRPSIAARVSSMFRSSPLQKKDTKNVFGLSAGAPPPKSKAYVLSPTNSASSKPSKDPFFYKISALSKEDIKRQNNAITLARVATDSTMCSCEVAIAEPVPLRTLDRDSLRSLCRSLGLPYKSREGRSDVVSRLSTHPTFRRAPGASHGNLAICRSCLRSASPPL